MDQKVSGWFGWVCERPTRALFPPADRVGLRYSLSITRNVVTSCLCSCGRLTVRHAVGGMGRDDGRSEGHPVMGWIRVESQGLTLSGPARVQTSVGCFAARKLVEPVLGGKANEATLCEPCALHRNGFWLSVCIAEVIEIFNRWVTSMPRLAFEGLEPYDGNLSRTVLRGLGASDGPRLPGVLTSPIFMG